MWKLVVAARQKYLGPSAQAVSDALFSLANCLDFEGKRVEAESLYLKALAMETKLVGPNHPNVGVMLVSLAGCESMQGKYDESLKHFARSIEILKSAGESTRAHLRTAFYGYARVLDRLGRPIDSEKVREEMAVALGEHKTTPNRE